MKFPKVNLKGIPDAVQILKGARERLDIYKQEQARKDFYVCNAVVRFAGDNPEKGYYIQAIQVTEKVQEAIHPYIFVTSWAEMVGATSQDQIDYRLAWIDHMLKELEDEVPES